MKTLLSLFCGAFLAIGSLTSLQGEIRETNEMSTALESVDQDSFVFLNVSSVMYGPGTTLANVQWRDYFSDRVQKIVFKPEIREEIIAQVKNAIVKKVPKKNLEEITPALISDLQQQQIVVLGISKKETSTSYADNFGEITSNHLLSLGIRLEDTLTYLKVQEDEEKKDYTLVHGILFTNKQPEGPALLSFLEQAQKTPSKIVMVDNSFDSLKSVKEALESKGIVFEGIRYGGADAIKESFDPTLGTIQFFSFIKGGQILSDEEASEIKSRDPEGAATYYEKELDSFIKEKALSFIKYRPYNMDK
jgi:hypothetical protein